MSPALFPLGLATLASMVGCHGARTDGEGAKVQVSGETQAGDESVEFLLGAAPTGTATACPTPTPTPVYTQMFFPTNLKPFGCWSDLIPGPTVPFTDGWKYNCSISDSMCTYGGKQCSSLETGGLCKICWPSSEDGNSHGQINRLCIGTTCTNTGSCPNKRLKPKFWDSATDVSGVALPVNDPSQQMTCVSGTAQVQENYCKDEAGNYELEVKETAYQPQGDVIHFTKKNQSCVNTKALCAEGKRETELGGEKVGIDCTQVPTPSPCAAPDGCPPGYRTSILPTPTPNPTPGPAPVPQWKVSAAGLEVLKAAEGTGVIINGTPYPFEAYSVDAGSGCNCTIGYGTLIHQGKCTKYPTRDQAADCPVLTASQIATANQMEDEFVAANGITFVNWTDAGGVVRQTMKITPAQASVLFKNHIAGAEKELSERLKKAKPCMTQVLFDSAMSVFYQMPGKFIGSEAEKYIRVCKLKEAEKDLAEFRKAGGKYDAGIRARRCGEAKSRNKDCKTMKTPSAVCHKPRILDATIPPGTGDVTLRTQTICEWLAGNPELKIPIKRQALKNYIQPTDMTDSNWKANCGW